MPAPIDSTATVDAGGEKVALRLNFRTLALAEAAGINVLDNPGELSTLDTARLVRSFATPDQPGFTDDQALALVINHSDELTPALVSLFAAVKGAGDENPPKAAKG